MTQPSLDDLLVLHRFSHTRAAKVSGVSRSSIYRWVYGRHRPMPKQLARLAKALGVDVAVVTSAIKESRRQWLAGTAEPRP